MSKKGIGSILVCSTCTSILHNGLMTECRELRLGFKLDTNIVQRRNIIAQLRLIQYD